MSTFEARGRTFRYCDYRSGDLNHCYNPACQDNGQPLVDYLARWENVSQVDCAPADAVLFTCADHAGPEFEEAKQLFTITQKTSNAAYLTMSEVRGRG